MFQGRAAQGGPRAIERNIEALNIAVADILREGSLHVCYGNWDGPAFDDVNLEPCSESSTRLMVGR